MEHPDALLIVGLVAGAGGPAPAFHEDYGRAVGDVVEQFRGLANQLGEHLRNTPARSRQQPGSLGGRAAAHHDHPEYRDQLALTPEQAARLETLRQEFTRESIRRDADLRIAEMIWTALLATPIEQGKTLLTPEQRTRLQAMLSSGMHHRSGEGLGAVDPSRPPPTRARGCRSARGADDDLEGRRRRLRPHGRRHRPGRRPGRLRDHRGRGGPGAPGPRAPRHPPEPGRAGRQGSARRDQRDADLGAAHGDRPPRGPRGRDLVIEAITENPAVKKETFARLDRICRPAALLASNTSSCTITELAAATKRPPRSSGLHFFNPAPLMKLVEVVRTILTGDPAFTTAWAFVQSLGKTPVAAKDTTGFIVNRLLVPYLLEAIRCSSPASPPRRTSTRR